MHHICVKRCSLGLHAGCQQQQQLPRLLVRGRICIVALVAEHREREVLSC